MGKTLVVFHSYTGNTKLIAENIKNKLDCEILELQPKIPFSNDYQEVVDKYQNNSIKEELEICEFETNLENFVNIIICSPVWWYTITPVVATFLKENNLSSKNIYPVATNAGWLGHTFQDIKKLCKNSIVKNGLNLVFDENYSIHKLNNIKDFENWLKIFN